MLQSKNIQDTLIRIELLTFFQANPHTRDTVNGLASRLHRSPQGIRKACDTLVSLGILQTNNNSKNNIYRLKNSELIKEFYQKCSNQDITLNMKESQIQKFFNSVRRTL